MTLLQSWGRVAEAYWTPGPEGGAARARRYRRVARRIRRLMAVGMAPVVAAGTAVMPVKAVPAAVVTAAPGRQPGGSGGGRAIRPRPPRLGPVLVPAAERRDHRPEADRAWRTPGYSPVTQATPATWRGR